MEKVIDTAIDIYKSQDCTGTFDVLAKESRTARLSGVIINE